MTSAPFEANVASREGGTVIVLSGTVDRAARDPLEKAFAEAARTPGEVILDFNAVDYINSTGIAVIVGVLGLARAEGRNMGAVGLTDHYREIFEITRLADFVHIHDEIPAGN